MRIRPGLSLFLIAMLIGAGALIARTDTVTAWEEPLFLRPCRYDRPIQLPTDQAALWESLVQVSGSGGSNPGIVVSPDGHVLTSGRVGQAGTVQVDLPGGRRTQGTVLRVDLIQDIALVKIPDGQIGPGQCLTLGLNDAPTIGTRLFLFRKARTDAEEIEVTQHQIWNRLVFFGTNTQAESGTPLVNRNGTVVGIITRNLPGPGLSGQPLGVPLSSIKKRLCLALVGETPPVCRVDSASELKEVASEAPPAPEPPPVKRVEPPPRLPAGDGIVTYRGLVWTVCSRGQEWTGTGCRGLSAPTNWKKAALYCTRISTPTRRWRLPKKEELETLVEPSGAPTINAQFFPRTAPKPYWTVSDFERGSSGSAWFVNFANGKSYGEWKSKHNHVRCVAGDASVPAGGGSVSRPAGAEGTPNVGD